MRRLCKIAACIFIGAAASTSCNSEVFVLPLEPSQDSYEAAEEGDSLSVRFRSESWRITEVNYNDEYRWDENSSFSGKSLDFDENGELTLSKSRFTISFRKEDSHRMKVFIQPNFKDEAVRTTVVISNGFDEDSLVIRQPRCTGYELDRMEWEGTVSETETRQAKGWSYVTRTNTGTDTLSLTQALYEGARRQVKFTDCYDFGYFHDDLTVEIPDGALTEGALSFNNGEKVAYKTKKFYYTYDDETAVVLKFPPATEGKKRYYAVLWSMTSYTTPYTMYLRNITSGKTVKVEGTLYSESPDGGYTIYYEEK
jgi:hypothetical protein